MYKLVKYAHKVGETCPACSLSVDKGGRLLQRKSLHGIFLGCNRYPLCKITCKIQLSKKNRNKKSYTYRSKQGNTGIDPLSQM
jgi:ssDNA-binding Zn-finger/Zn-ribbon topoisomerase 1